MFTTCGGAIMAGNDDTILVKWNGSERRFGPHEGVTIGRDPTSVVVLVHDSVSRRHAELRFVGDHWVLTDLGSTQGTRCEGARFTTLDVQRPTTVVVGHPTDGLVVEMVPAETVTQLGDMP